MRHTIRLADREISSGSPGEAIASVQLTRRVNRGEEFCVGSVCPALLEVSFLELSKPIPIGAKMELLDEAGNLQGTFYCQAAETTEAATNITAYDSLYFLEKDVTQWLSDLDGWPYTLQEFAAQVCQVCGVTYSGRAILNANYPVAKFTGNTTGRALLSFVGELCGSYLVAEASGEVSFTWYWGKEVETSPILQKKFSDFVTAPIDKVQIRQTEQDVGTVYPDVDAANTYCITGNPLAGENVQSIAENLFYNLETVSYTPGEITLPETYDISPGDIVDIAGKPFYVMQAVYRAGETVLSSFGQEKLQSVSVRNQEKFTALSGRVLELTTQVEGLKAENRDAAGNLAQLSLTVEEISSQVAAQSQENGKLTESVSQISQKADTISATVSTVVTQGVSRVETEFGMTLDGSCLTIARQGSEMTNRLDETGMYVVRSEGSEDEVVMLQANADGVVATDVTVRNYLRLGEHARFEDYGANRTACYYQ